jgi:TonB family protein
MSLAVSLCMHGALLAWMVLGPPLPGSERRKSIYDQEIKPGEKKIIWYDLREKLPDISPSDAPLDSQPPRARAKAKQIIVSGPKDEEGATQRIFMPAPEVNTPKPLPLPNVIAVAPKMTKPFVAPPDVIREPKPKPALPDAPKVAEAAAKPVELATAALKPKPLDFTPPPEQRMLRQALLQLPEAPATATVVEPNALPFEAGGARPQRRAYTPPTGAQPRRDAPVSLPNAPEIASTSESAAAGVKGIPRTFVAPPSRPATTGEAPSVSTDAPMVSGPSNTQAETTLAIVGLNPANMRDVPAPPGSRAAGFSAGPQLRPAGGMGSAGGSALLGVPGLLVRGGANDAQSTLAAAALLTPTSKENLMAAARTVTPAPAALKPPPEANAPRIAEAPDPRLAGRVVYAVAIQMPNVTSFSGSWLVWFAEHEPVPGAPPMEIKAPTPLHKVDPKYIAAAAAERIEGKVRLFGVIRKDGHVDGIALLQHVDVRLDRSAAEALGQWVFDPALRNGRPVEVDAVFEIPFHLAPRATK